MHQGCSTALWGARHSGLLRPFDEVSRWSLGTSAKTAIERILRETATDPIGPEFMAPPPRSVVIQENRLRERRRRRVLSPPLAPSPAVSSRQRSIGRASGAAQFDPLQIRQILRRKRLPSIARPLDGNVLKLMNERGKLAQQDAAAQAGNAGNAPPRSGLEQPRDRHPRIAALIDQLWADYPDLNKLSAPEILDVERDYYIADVWTEYVEPRLDIFSNDRLAGRRQALQHLADALLESLFRNPKSDNTQILLDLLRSDLMPDEIAASVANGEARIDCDPKPKYLEPLDVAFVFTNPLIDDVPAARRLLTYSWVISDASAQPPNVDRFRYYFRRPDFAWRLPWTAAPAQTRTLTATVQVPFTAAAPITLPTLTLTLRRPRGTWWRVEPMELASFCVTLAIATVSAFGTQYASSLPNVITWSDWVSAFLFGFGLDQLRDTVSTPANSTTTAGAHPPPTPAPARAAPHAA